MFLRIHSSQPVVKFSLSGPVRGENLHHPDQFIHNPFTHKIIYFHLPG